LSNGPEPSQKVIVFAFAIGVQQEIQNITISLGRMIFPMTSDQFRAALADLGLSQAGFARLAMVDARTVRRWCDGTRAVPGPVVALLGMMDKQRLTSP
jgi:DNA-binding transcriptional regulator YiaG